jgi:hypothetical protein
VPSGCLRLQDGLLRRRTGHCDFKFVAFFGPSFFYQFSCLRSHKPLNLLGLYGGDDGARTRDLCRDSLAL